MFIAPEILRGNPTDISEELARLNQRGKVPALAAAAVLKGEIVAAGATGIRKVGDPTPVTINDKFHIGSCTKSMTGTLAGILVSTGEISWETTVEESFPKMNIHPGYRTTTLLQLLSNSGGAPGEIPDRLWEKTLANVGSPESSQRTDFIEAILKSPPEYPPGTRRVYSNAGFTIAGAMLEKASGESFPDLLRNRLFEPLEMKSAGFGAPATPGKTDQPYGHTKKFFMTFPVDPGPDADNPPAITPAGRVHLSIPDLAKYVRFHLGFSENPPLSRREIEFLHTAVPPGDDYALGWNLLEREWAGGPVLQHNGSNTMNYTVMWLAPEKDFAAVAACNDAGPLSRKACDEAVTYLIGKYLEEK